MRLASHRHIQRRSLHEEVVYELREMIIGSVLKPGDRIVESDFCEMFDISRTPLREALKVLETEGLVTLRPNRGARVSEFSEKEVSELFEVIANLERVAVELAVERMDGSHLQHLERLHKRMIRLYEKRRRRECFEADYEIHKQIVALTGNSILMETHAGLMTKARRGRYLALFSQERWVESMAEHEELMAAIAAGNSALAGDVMRRHVIRTGVVVRETLSLKHVSNGKPKLYATN